LKAIELDKLQNEFYIARIKRIKLFGDIVKSIKKELDKRDLEGLKT